MSQQSILELAKQGDAQAIAALINRTLQPKGITAKASLKNNCLRVILEAEEVPDQKSTTAFIQRGVQGLGVAAITKIQVFGIQSGEEVPAWSNEILLGSTKPLPPKPAAPSSTTKKSLGKVEMVLGSLFWIFVVGGCVNQVGRPWNCSQARKDLDKAEQEYKSETYAGMSSERAQIALRGNMHQVARKQEKVAQKCN